MPWQAACLGHHLFVVLSGAQPSCPISGAAWLLSDVRRGACPQLKEGQIEEGSPAWEAMSAADRSKRKRAAAEARTKLKSPNFFLSRTRLCLRNLPLNLSEKALKDLVIAAVRPPPSPSMLPSSCCPVAMTHVSAALVSSIFQPMMLPRQIWPVL
jgi:hypothetical protein